MKRFIPTWLLTFLLGGMSAQTSPQALLTSVSRGQALYQAQCAACHRRSGQGLGKKFPPLAQSDYLLTDVDRAIKLVWTGLAGPIVVNGRGYDQVMAPIALSEGEMVDVMNYVLHAWGNDGPVIDSAWVRRVQQDLPAED
jgi:mono/diheme cytochrome c family protein